ncbi:ABC transporter permease [Rhodococcus maanshanensis]|uniref:Peptide/nickel transport system permease protein n=1 Tax=Rhodococcus maanshanensis TaxID=183556 RepID=A0A1H7XAG7_9NOCA|nr:ABC transporter permease [Rhodococcus maanshanensis]SEM30882.1 peptide/nickel transport system permease protein [Rhodococcus maanshanensis]
MAGLILARYAGVRVALGVAQVLGVLGIVFAVASVLPGDAAVVIAADDADPERIAQLRTSLGLDRPLLTQFGDWMSGLLHGDLGTSAVSGRPVTDLLFSALAPTLTLAALALAALVPLAVGLGVAAAVGRGGPIDRAISGMAVALYAAPEFALAIILVAVFAVGLGLFAPTAVGASGPLLLQPELWVLPVAVLVIRPVCSLSRLVRASMITTLDSEHVRHTLRLGVPERRVVWRHALPGSLTPAIQHLARVADWLLGGVVVIEAVFAVGGLGQVLVDAIRSRDISLLMGLVALFGLITVMVNTIADIMAYRLNPTAGEAS